MRRLSSTVHSQKKQRRRESFGTALLIYTTYPSSLMNSTSQHLPIDAPVARTDNNLSSSLAGEEVILNLLDGVYYGLNEVGARIWTLMETADTPREICDALEEEYEVDRSTLEADVCAILKDMEEAGLIERRTQEAEG